MKIRYDKILSDLREYDSIRWLGDYDAGISYIVDDAVFYNGSSYICIATTTGNLPTDATYWHIMAQKGDAGVSGISGSLVSPFSNQTTVTVNHNFNAYPAVQVINGSGVLLEDADITSITHNSTNQITVVFPNPTSGNIICTIGGVSTKVVIKAANYTLTDEDNTVLVTDEATMTLPAVSGRQGITYNIKHMATTGINITVEADGVETIDEQHYWVMNAKYTVMTVHCTGTEWIII